jgi:hypothetical protein
MEIQTFNYLNINFHQTIWTPNFQFLQEKNGLVAFNSMVKYLNQMYPTLNDFSKL